MNNEDTRLINDNVVSNNAQASAATPNVRQKKGNGLRAAFGGFAAGAAVGTAATAAATNSNEEEVIAPDIVEEENQSAVDETAATDEQEAATPTPEQAILANDEGVRFAHVDGTTFNEAFAQARAQVGPGGVFEYDGRLYGTYYTDEWNAMSQQERADYQSRVNEVAPSHHSTPSHHTPNDYMADNSAETIPANAEMIAEEHSDNEIRVLGVEAVQDEYGRIMNVALVESDGDQALLVDVDNDGTIDVLLHDDNHDGNLQQSEIHDISGAGLDVADLMQNQAAYDANNYYAANDDMPDYMNDADLTMDV